MRLASEAVAGVDEAAAPVRSGILRARLGRYLFHIGRTEDSLAEYRRAVDLVPASPPSSERAWVMSTLGQSLMLAHRLTEAVPWLAPAIAMARTAGDRTVEGHASNTLGVVHGFLGRREEAEALLREAGRIAAEIGSPEDLCRYYTNIIGVLEIDGRNDEVLALAAEGAEVARRNGLERSHGLWLRLDTLFTRARLSDWAAVETELAAIERYELVGLSRLQHLTARGLLALARGDLDGAAADIGEAAEQGREVGTPDFIAPTAVAEAELALARGDPALAARLALVAAERLDELDDRVLLWPLLALGIRAAADHVEAARAAGDAAGEAEARAGAERLEALVARVGSEPGRHGRAAEPERLQIAAERARLESRADPAAWTAVAAARAALGQRGGEGYARLREAGAYLEARPPIGRRPRGAGRAADLAASTGEVRLAKEVASLARRHRLKVAFAAAAAGTGPADGRDDGRARPVAPGDGGPGPGERGPDEPPDRRGAVHQPQDGERPRVEHPHQAGGVESGRGRGPRGARSWAPTPPVRIPPRRPLVPEPLPRGRGSAEALLEGVELGAQGVGELGAEAVEVLLRLLALRSPLLRVDVQRLGDPLGVDVEAVEVQVGGEGTAPIGVSVAPASPSRRRQIHSRTREFSP